MSVADLHRRAFRKGARLILRNAVIAVAKAPVWSINVALSIHKNVRFSNRPFGVKRLQTIHHLSVDVAHGLVLLSESAPWPFHHGIRGRVEQSFARPYHQKNGRSKRDMRTHLIHSSREDIIPPLGGARVLLSGM